MNGDQNPDVPPTGWQFSPSDTVSPESQALAPAPVPASDPTPVTAVQPSTTPQSVASPSVVADALQPAVQSKQVEASQSSQPPELASPVGESVITWTASEYVAHQKTISWYALLLLVALVLAAVTYLVTRDKVSAGSIMLIAFVFGLYGSRKPRVLGYKLDSSGLTIAQKFYDYGLFRSFAVMHEDAFSSIALVPLRRFMPLLAIYYSPEDEDKIVKILANRLPIEQRKRDAIDGLMHKIRF